MRRSAEIEPISTFERRAPNCSSGSIVAAADNTAAGIATIAGAILGGQGGARQIQPDVGHRGLELVAVLGLLDRLDVGSDQLDAESVEDTGFAL